MPTNAQLTDEYLALVAERGGDAQGRLAAREHMNNSTAIYHHEVVDSSYVPRLYNRETHERFAYRRNHLFDFVEGHARVFGKPQLSSRIRY